MGSTFGGIEISKKGLNVHQTALNTTGHNISNADNKNYSRQRVNLESSSPIYEPSFNRSNSPGQLGQGVEIANIKRIRDFFYDDQIITAENTKNFWEANQSYLTQIEHIFNEPADNNLRSLLDKFWSSWQELANYPADLPHREVVMERAKAFTTRINDTFNKLEHLRVRANQEIAVDVDQVNTFASELMNINERISKIEFLGDNPNDLLDKRDALLEKLSSLVDIRVGRSNKNEMLIFIGEQILVQGNIQRKLMVDGDTKNEGFYKIKWEHNDKDVILKNGHIYGLLQVRDDSILRRVKDLDLYAQNIADIVNEIHRDGFGINGLTNKNFFNIKPLSTSADGGINSQNDVANVDINKDGIPDSTAIFRVTGVNKIDPTKQIGIQGVITLHKNNKENTAISITYKNEDTVQNVITRINNSKTGVVAYLNHENKIALKASEIEDTFNNDILIRHIEDSGEFLVGFGGILNSSGTVGAFNYNQVGEISKLRSPLKDITLTPRHHPAFHLELAINDPATIATGRGIDKGGTGDKNTPNGVLDNGNALMIARALKQGKNMVGHAVNAEEFYNTLIAKLGTESRSANDAVQRFKDDLVNLNALRQSVMGVNLDEEMSNMIQFQHAYNASAKMLQTQNELLDEIIKTFRT